MKVVCIDNTHPGIGDEITRAYGRNTYFLTIGETYDAILPWYEKHNNPPNSYLIYNDKGDIIRYNKNLFKLICEVRDEKLNQIGI